MSALADPSGLGWLPIVPAAALPFVVLGALLLLIVQRATASAVGAGASRVARFLDVAVWPLGLAALMTAGIQLAAVLG